MFKSLRKSTTSLTILIVFIISFVTVPSLSEPSDHVITSCLTHHDITNFTTFPSSENDSAANYYKILNFSIHNLRFAQPFVPKPAAIILPESAEQLVNTVLCCKKVSWEIRVRCGGHSYEGTSSVSTDGAPFVIIDLMNLNRVLVDLKSEMAWVEGGATLGEAYYAIAELSNVHGFSAGSCPTVGIGGHISGGGFGLLSRKYGLAADNVVDALLVDAEGRLLDRNAMGEDVFWAIRGGGGGIWGIVYAWKIQLSSVPQTVTSFIVSRPGTIGEVAELVHKWQYVGPNLQGEFYLSVFVGAGLPETEKKAIEGISATFKGFYLGAKSDAVAILNNTFPELGIVEEDCMEMSWIESVLYFSGLNNNGRSSISDLRNRYLQDKLYFKAKSDYVRTAIPISGIKTALDILEKEPRGYVILDPYGGMMNKISSDSIAFPHREGNIFTIQYLVDWEEEDNVFKKSDRYIDWIRGFYNSMTPYVSWGPRAAYVNYLDLDLGVVLDDHDHDYYLVASNHVNNNAVEMARAWGEKYFLNNYDRLVRAKTFIDPNNVFSNQQGIPPLLSEIVW